MGIDLAVLSSPGGRDVNEDAYGHASTPRGDCFVVADGLGGHRGGRDAASLAVERALEAHLEQPDISPEAAARYVNSAHRGLCEWQESAPEYKESRTTLVLLLTDGLNAAWTHAGDSRLYHFRAGRVHHQTLDHSVPQALVQAGELEPEALRHHEDRNRVLRALGGSDECRAEEHPRLESVQDEDAFLLCSDGFWELVVEAEIEACLASSPDAQTWLEAMEQLLLERAEGAYDNYTALAVRVTRDGPRPWIRRGLAWLLNRFPRLLAPPSGQT
jgi:serine/threonine protein phosphatase PrpC